MNNHETKNGTPGPHAHASWGRRFVFIGIAVGALSATGVAGAIGGSFGASIGMGPFGMERRLASVLGSIDATPDQEKKIWAIIDAARADVRPTIHGFHHTREQVISLLGGSIDRAAVERFRLERVAAIDAASKKMSAAIVDAAEVLTADQRAKLGEVIRARGRLGPW